MQRNRLGTVLDSATRGAGTLIARGNTSWHRVVGVMLVLVAPAGCHAGTVTFSPQRLPEATSGQAYSATIVVRGNETPVNAIYLAEGRLPSGLALSYQRLDSAATISGTPRDPGQYVFTIEATCLGTNRSGQQGRQVDTLVVR